MSAFTKQAVIRDFNKAAINYDKNALVQRKTADHLFSLIRQHIRDSSNIIDIGCGTGYFHELLRKNKIYNNLVQTDIAKNMCVIADDYSSAPPYGKTDTICCDLDNLPFSDCFDIAFSSLTLQWSNNLPDSLNSIRSTLKDSGIFAFSTLIDGSLYQISDVTKKIDGIDRINRFQTEDEILQKITESGFKVLNTEIQGITIYHESFKNMLNSIRGVGASRKTQEKYAGRNYFKKMEDIYNQNYSNQEGIPLYWKTLNIVAKK